MVLTVVLLLPVVLTVLVVVLLLEQLPMVLLVVEAHSHPQEVPPRELKVPLVLFLPPDWSQPSYS
jgi:hypothetical protein